MEPVNILARYLEALFVALEAIEESAKREEYAHALTELGGHLTEEAQRRLERLREVHDKLEEQAAIAPCKEVSYRQRKENLV